LELSIESLSKKNFSSSGSNNDNIFLHTHQRSVGSWNRFRNLYLRTHLANATSKSGVSLLGLVPARNVNLVDKGDGGYLHDFSRQRRMF
jgi:hypothetical protein